MNGTTPKFTCPECDAKGIDNFIQYQEICVTEWRALTKDGKVSKYTSNIDKDKSTMPWGLKCKNCNTYFDYDTDETGKIIDIKFK